jgi:hypothetical protein
VLSSATTTLRSHLPSTLTSTGDSGFAAPRAQIARPSSALFLRVISPSSPFRTTALSPSPRTTVTRCVIVPFVRVLDERTHSNLLSGLGPDDAGPCATARPEREVGWAITRRWRRAALRPCPVQPRSGAGCSVRSARPSPWLRPWGRAARRSVRTTGRATQASCAQGARAIDTFQVRLRKLGGDSGQSRDEWHSAPQQPRPTRVSAASLRVRSGRRGVWARSGPRSSPAR